MDFKQLAKGAAEICMHNQQEVGWDSDVDVFAKDHIDQEYVYPEMKEWLAQTYDGYMYEFDTEDDACEFQREYRIAMGLDPMTGVKACTT